VTLVLAAFVAPLLVVALYALDRHVRAARTRRQLLDALVAVPEVAGAAPPAHADRVAAVADALARAQGFDRRRRAHIVTAARLSRLGHIAAPHDVVLTPAAAAASVAAAAGIPVGVVGLLAEAQGAPPGAAGPAAAVVRAAEALVSLVQGRPSPA